MCNVNVSLMFINTVGLLVINEHVFSVTFLAALSGLSYPHHWKLLNTAYGTWQSELVFSVYSTVSGFFWTSQIWWRKKNIKKRTVI
jgi:hypothetical protein